MSNRTLIVLTSLFFVGIIVLFSINMTSILTGQQPKQTYLQYNNVRGMAIVQNKLKYTLNFQQQNKIIDILNEAVPITELKENRKPPNIEKLIVYQFDGLPDIELTPIGYQEKNMIFSAPKWVENGYLMEVSEGNLQKLLAQTYD